jgi:hypothetical protein
VAHHLEKHLPNERNVAVYNYDPILIKKSFLRKHYDLGTGTTALSPSTTNTQLGVLTLRLRRASCSTTVEVHRALDRTDTSISSFGRSDADVHKGELIEDSTEHAFHVLKILPFERKLSVATNIFDQHGDRDSGLIVRSPRDLAARSRLAANQRGCVCGGLPCVSRATVHRRSQEGNPG